MVLPNATQNADDIIAPVIKYNTNYDDEMNFFDTSSVEDIVTTTNMMTYPAYGTIQPYTTTSTVETIINQFTTTVETVYGPPAWFTSTTTTEDIFRISDLIVLGRNVKIKTFTFAD